MTRPRMCAACGIRPIAYPGRDQCYVCKPAAYRKLTACRRCGSTKDYFTNGLCRRCHRNGGWIDSCLDCLAWGATARYGWRCWACDGWLHRFGDPDPSRPCRSCRRIVVVNQRGYCRLCCRQATLVRAAHTSIDIAAANRAGQQLFLADMLRQKHDRLTYGQALKRAATMPIPRPYPGSYPVSWRQLLLFDDNDALRDIAAGIAAGFPDPPLPDLAALAQDTLREHATRHGWSRATTAKTDHALRIILALQHSPGTPITATEITTMVNGLPNATARPVREILHVIGMLDDDRPPPLQDWFTARTSGLPDPMLSELRSWLTVMREGSSTPPRSHPRNPASIYAQLTGILPAAQKWAAAGHTTLRTITTRDVHAVLPTHPVRRTVTVCGLRSLFRILKAHRVTFTNPAAGLQNPPWQPTQTLPLDLDPVRQALDSNNAAKAALTALIAFHALRSRELRTLLVTDIHDRRLYLPDRTIPLADPARDRLNHWLDHRARHWPNTCNPHLFINHYTAVRTTPVTNVWINDTLGLPARSIRDDRILHEALATQGDARHLCDLFGLNIASTVRYTGIPTAAIDRAPASSPTRDQP
jgi:hypothetical protein